MSEERMKEINDEMVTIAANISRLNCELRPLEFRFAELLNEKYELSKHLTQKVKKGVRVGKKIREDKVDFRADFKALMDSVLAFTEEKKEEENEQE